jgi:hypothetical protein
MIQSTLVAAATYRLTVSIFRSERQGIIVLLSLACNRVQYMLLVHIFPSDQPCGNTLGSG